jgi:hypothetical protein
MKMNQPGEAGRKGCGLEPTDALNYRPAGDERYQLELELKKLSGKIYQCCTNTDCIDKISSLSELSHELDEVNAKLKMHIRNLKARQGFLLD